MRSSIGKIPYKELRRVLGIRPSLDSSTLDGMLASTNPAIGLPDDELGFFAYHYSASNVAVAFAKPRYMLVNAVFPPGYPLDSIGRILADLGAEASRYGTRVIGGHTARYKGVSLPIIATTALGPRIRARRPPSTGDNVYLVGQAGLEAAKLLGKNVPLEELTPLPKALTLLPLNEVKFMHDVSEGGVAGALLEVAEATGHAVRVINLPKKPALLPPEVDVMSAPSYGALLAFTERGDLCGKVDYTCIRLGVVEKGPPKLIIGDTELLEAPPNPLWELYGEKVSGDPALRRVYAAARAIASAPGIERLIPEVGMNIAYAPFPPTRVADVAAVDGRIVRTSTGARVCGEPRYGASKHLARILVEAAKTGLQWRAAVNTRVDDKILSALASLGVKPVEVEARGACPVAEALARGVRSRALWYGPAPGLEPSLVLLGSTPEELVAMLSRLLAGIGVADI